MWVLTVIDEGIIEKYLEFKEEKEAINVQLALVENGCMVKRRWV